MSPLITPWSVLWLVWKFAETPTVINDKFTIVVGIEDAHLLTIVINTEVHPFVAADPVASQCQILMDQANHRRFLAYDSYAACHRIHRKSIVDADRQLRSDVDRFRGHVHSSKHADILQAICASDQVSDYHKEIIAKYLA